MCTGSMADLIDSKIQNAGHGKARQQLVVTDAASHQQVIASSMQRHDSLLDCVQCEGYKDIFAFVTHCQTDRH